MDVGHLIGARVEDDAPRRDADALRDVGQEGVTGILRQRSPVGVHRTRRQSAERRRRATAGQQLAGAAAALHRVALGRLPQGRMTPDMGGQRGVEGADAGEAGGWRAALAAQQAIQAEQRPCRRLLARLPECDRLHRQRAALAGPPRQQVVARREGCARVAAVEVGVDVARLPHLEGGIEDIGTERRRLPVGRHRLVEPARRVENVRQGEMGLGILGLDGERAPERVRRLVEIAPGMVDQPDAEHGAGVIGAERGGPAEGLGGALQVPPGTQRLAEIDMRLGPRRVDLDRAAVGGEGGVEAACRLEHVAEVVVGAGVALVEGDGALQERRRLVHRVEPEGDQRTALQRLPVVRPGGEDPAVERPRFREPPGPSVERGAAHGLADARRREALPPASVRFAPAVPQGNASAARALGGDARAVSDLTGSARSERDPPPPVPLLPGGGGT